MSLFLESLKGHRVVTKGVADICEVCHPGDGLDSALLSSHLSSELFALLVICHFHEIFVALMASCIFDTTLSHISESLIDEAAQLKCCVVL